MRVTHLGHSSVLVETADARILLDPGVVSAGWHGLTDLDAVLITHQHPDHLDPERAGALAKANPGARWVVEPFVLPLVPAGATALAPGRSTTIGDLTVTAVGGRHAVVHPDIPRIGNVGFLLRGAGEPTLYHPGDSYQEVAGVDVLAVPLNAPWGRVAEAVDFVRGVAAQAMFPIHDGFLNERGRALYLSVIDALTQTELTDLSGHLSTEY